VPPTPPAAQFGAATVYNITDGTMTEVPRLLPSVDGTNKKAKNDDGSIELCFGPRKPRKPRGKGRPFEPGNPGGGRPKGSKTRTPLQKALEKPKPRGKPGIPGNCNGGRPKGSPNKISRDLKEAYLLAANFAGGKEGW
jgi:hypothetical protein